MLRTIPRLLLRIHHMAVVYYTLTFNVIQLVLNNNKLLYITTKMLIMNGLLRNHGLNHKYQKIKLFMLRMVILLD